MSGLSQLARPEADSLPTRGLVRSVNVGAVKVANPEKPETSGTGIYKLPVEGAVRVQVPRPKNSGPGQSGLVGDIICDIKHHGGPDQAVYAYAREDLDWWGERLGRELPDGMFGENLTTEGLNLTDAVIGERWRIGEELVLEARLPRIPCVTFAAKMAEPRWIKRFTEVGVTGAYLRVITPGEVRAGDGIEVLTRPAHGVSIATYFRAITTERDRLAELVPAREFLAQDTLEDLARLGDL
ncbi:MAG TPA: MOSC domain-containing protein [Actinospica sp.]|nr:MOSC domain-containing protein [Actinospica sp.]